MQLKFLSSTTRRSSAGPWPRILGGKDYEVETVQDGAEGLRRVERSVYDLVILDIMMPDVSGLDILQRVKESHPDTDVIMITGLAQIETAVQSMKLGAFDYIPKPFTPEELTLSVERSLERRRLLRENTLLRAEAGSKYRFENIIGAAPQMQNVYRLIAKCAPTNSTVFIRGESGTGKELIARAIHYNSLRKDKPFVPVDCGSLSETLLESELFGHIKGAFTGARDEQAGALQGRRRRDPVLDEIGNISPATQAKLLRVLQEHEYKPVGDTRTQPSNIRLITATNLDINAMVAAGKFREDLFYRINIFPIVLPPLRERREDIPALAYHFLKTFSDELGKQGARHLPGGDEHPDEPRLAGEHPRTGKHPAPRRDPHQRPPRQPGAPGERPRHGAAARGERAEIGGGAQERQEGHPGEIRRGRRAALRPRGAQAQPVERDAQRRGDRHAAHEFPGADEEIPDPGAAGRRARSRRTTARTRRVIATIPIARPRR